jgi:hypothetical protein
MELHPPFTPGSGSLITQKEIDWPNYLSLEGDVPDDVSIMHNRINIKLFIPRVNICSESAETFHVELTTEELARELF